MTVPTRVDPIDGPERFCRRCEIWWPDDGEFWYYARRLAGSIGIAGERSFTRRVTGNYSVCKACHQERNRLNYARNRDRYCADRRARYCQRRRPPMAA